MNSFYIVHFMIFGLDSEYCTILFRYQFHNQNHARMGGGVSRSPSSSEKKSNFLNSYSKITKH